MYHGLKLAPTIKPLLTTNVSEATEFVTKLKVTPKVVTLQDVDVDEEGKLKCNGEFHKITEFGFDSFCKLLGIPNNFAHKIPADLLFDNVKRLIKSKPDLEMVVLFRDNDEIAGVCKPPYEEKSYVDVLATFAEKPELSYIDITEELLTIGFWYENRLIPKADDDPLHVGTYVYSSILKGCNLHAFSGIWRSACKNNFVMPFFGKVKANYKKEDLMLQNFSDLLQCYDSNIYNRFQRDFHAFNTRKLFDNELASVWKSISKIVSPSETDSFMNFTEEERKTLLTKVQTRFVENKRARLVGGSIEEASYTGVLAYDVINNMTAHARDYLHGREKLAVEKLAGTWIEKIILN